MVSPEQDFEGAFTEMRRKQAVIVQPSLLRKDAVELALKHRLPSFAPTKQFSAMGGLASYPAKIFDVYRETAVYVDKVLKGAKPAELPIAFPTRFELVINLKTAMGLGLTVPPTLLARTDEVIE
jgi:putative tryptophan/tyrosine transport system substrate-binding protein